MGSDVRFLWPDGEETTEKIVSKPVNYETVAFGGLRTARSELPTIRISHRGLDVVLYDLDGLKVHRDDVKRTLNN